MVGGSSNCPVGVVIVAFPGVESGSRVLGRSTEREGGTRGGHNRCRRGGGRGERGCLGRRDYDRLWASWGGVEGNRDDRPGTGGGLVFTRIAGRLGHKSLFAGLVDPSDDTGDVRSPIHEIPHCPDKSLPLATVGFVRAGAGFGGAGVIDGGQGGRFSVFERGGVDWGLVDLVEEEIFRVWVEGLGIGPTLANRWMLVEEFCVDVDLRMGWGVAGGEEGATHWRLDEGEGVSCRR